jgi:hypothetical protein
MQHDNFLEFAKFASASVDQLKAHGGGQLNADVKPNIDSTGMLVTVHCPHVVRWGILSKDIPRFLTSEAGEKFWWRAIHDISRTLHGRILVRVTSHGRLTQAIYEVTTSHRDLG